MADDPHRQGPAGTGGAPRPPRAPAKEYLVHLRIPDTNPPAINRLRGVLKTALRAFGARCVSVREAPEGEGRTDADVAKG